VRCYIFSYTPRQNRTPSVDVLKQQVLPQISVS